MCNDRLNWIRSSLSRCEGYNLLMSAIALIVIGLVSVSLLNAYGVYEKHLKATRNQEIISNAVNKIQIFKENFGRLPCPSSLNAARNSPLYGSEDCSTVIAAGTCSGGICVTEGRTIPPAATPELIRTGSIPFRLLQIDEKEVYDAFGSRLVYSMTQNMGAAATYNEMNGAIGLADETGQSLTTPVGGADFVIISHGNNKIGAYNSNGTQTLACAGGLETANCIDMAAPPAAPTTFVSSLTYLAGGANEFDDTIEYFASNEVARWRRTDTNKDDIQTISNTNVGVGVADPDSGLDIGQNNAAGASTGKSATWDGGLRVTTIPSTTTRGRVDADSICSEDGTECFRPENFATTGMTPCPAGKYMVGIRGTGTDAEPICQSVRVYCAAPQVLTGIDAAGNAKCSDVSSNCLEKEVQICNVAYSGHSVRSSTELPISNPTLTRYKMVVDTGEGIHNNNYQIFDQGAYAPNRAWATFKCTNGDWVKTGAIGGLCSCTPPVPPTSTCTVVPAPSPTCTGGGTCAGSGTGASTIVYTYDPVACQWNGGPPDFSTCSCPAIPPSGPPPLGSCGPGYNSGNNPASWSWNSSPSVCAWVAGPGTCACLPANATPPAAAHGDTRVSTTPPDTVACNTLPGFAGFSGNAYRRYKFDATVGSCAWLHDGWDTSGCTCDTATLHPEPAPTTCNLVCEKETGGAINWYRYTLPGCVKTLDHSDPSACTPKIFKWQIDPTSPPLTGQDDHGPIKVGDACNLSCPSPDLTGSTDSCWAEDVGGKYKIYTCICKPSL